jgi:sulfite reductase beta subunit-like hemoprotein
MGLHKIAKRAVVRDGKRGFRMVVGGGLGPLPTEAHLLDEFVPEERLVNRIEAVLRLFNKHGNRGNKNKARLKFILRERGWEWVKEQIEREYDQRRDSRAGSCAGRFWWFSSSATTAWDGC